MALLASVKTTDAQIVAVGAVKLNLLRLVVGLKRIESDFHAVAAKLGIDGEVPAVHGHIGEVAMHDPPLAVLKHLDDALGLDVPLETRAGFVTFAGRLTRLAVYCGVIFDLEPGV